MAMVGIEYSQTTDWGFSEYLWIDYVMTISRQLIAQWFQLRQLARHKLLSLLIIEERKNVAPLLSQPSAFGKPLRDSRKCGFDDVLPNGMA